MIDGSSNHLIIFFGMITTKKKIDIRKSEGKNKFFKIFYEVKQLA